MRFVNLSRFRHVSKMFMSCLYLFNFGMAGNVTFTTLMIAYYDFWNSPIECIYVLLVWSPIWTLYAYICAIYAYYVFYYFIIFTCFFRCIIAEIRANLMVKIDRSDLSKLFATGNTQWEPLRPRFILQLMLTYNQILRLLKGYDKLWSCYISFVVIIFNGLVCFNFYLFLYTNSTYYIKMVYIVTSITAFNIFFCGNYFAAKIVVANSNIIRPLFSLFARKQIGRQKFTVSLFIFILTL